MKLLWRIFRLVRYSIKHQVSLVLRYQVLIDFFSCFKFSLRKATAPGSLSENICLSCHRVFIEAHLCIQCNNRLCSRTCETSPEHAKECFYLSKLVVESKSDGNGESASRNGQPNINVLLLPFRLLRLRDENPEKWQLLLSLEAHEEARKKTPIYEFIENNITPYLKIMLADEWEGAELGRLTQKICGIIDVNSFGEQINLIHSHMWESIEIIIDFNALEIRIDSCSQRRFDLQTPGQYCKYNKKITVKNLSNRLSAISDKYVRKLVN